MVTRRTRCRAFLLRPSEETDEIFLYLLAVFVVQYGLLAHAITCLSNHYHFVATDPRGRIADFTRDFHAFVARHVNAIHAEFENLWATTQTNLVRLRGGIDIVDKIAYTMANPVLSYLVEEGSSWPGVRRAWPAPPMVIKRPEGFFDVVGEGSCRWPEEITLEMARPPVFDDLSDPELAEIIALSIEAKEEVGRRTAAAKGIPFVGRETILRQSRHATPSGYEPHFGIVPRVACKDEWRRKETLRFNRDWLEWYARSLARWRAGERDVIFPYGTNKMRTLHGVRVEPRPGAAPPPV